MQIAYIALKEFNDLILLQGNNFMVPPGDPFQLISGLGGGQTPGPTSPSQPGTQVTVIKSFYTNLQHYDTQKISMFPVEFSY